MSRFRARAVACAGMISIGASLLVGGTVTSGTAYADSAKPTACLTAQRSLTGHVVDTSSFDDSGIVTIDGWTVDVDVAHWHAADKRNPTLTTAFHSDAWLIPDTNDDLSGPVAAMVEQSTASPDPGGESERDTQMRTGWKEGHVTRRLGTALCLYEWTTSTDDRAALTPVIEQLAAAASDPARYYGPPLYHAHNHGLMSDITLDRAGRMLNRPEWTETATNRVRLQLADTFDSCGMVYEQASAYQQLHASLWRRIARFMSGDAAVEATNASLTAQLRADQLRDLDGSLPIIGDIGASQTNAPLDGWVPTASSLWCPETGWFAQTTISDDIRQHAVVRFGPRQKMHGHKDHGSITWTVGNRESSIPVLADRGLYDKQRGTGRFDYARSVAAHSTLQAPDLQGDSMSGIEGQTPAGRMVFLSARPWHGTWTRLIEFRSRAMQLTVTDSLTGEPSHHYQSQRFSLDPRWQRHGRSIVADGGWRLTIRCTANGAPVAPVYTTVEHFPGGHIVQPALAVDCQSPKHDNGTQLRAVLTVTHQ